MRDSGRHLTRLETPVHLGGVPPIAPVQPQLSRTGWDHPSDHQPQPGRSPAPSALSLLISASNAISTSPSGSATVSSEGLGNALLAEQAEAVVNLSAPIPLSSPASSVDVTIPFTTSGVTWSSPAGSDQAVAEVSVVPLATYLDSIKCADGSFGVMAVSSAPHSRVPHRRGRALWT